MTADDWPAVHAIYAEGIRTGHATFESDPPDWDRFDTTRMPGHRLVAVHRERVIGWVAVSAASSRTVYSGVVEHSVYVAENARGHGAGTALLDALIGSTEAAGIWTLQSGIFPENAGSLRLHQRAGFRVIGVRERIAHMSHGPLAGQWRDVLLIERRSPVIGR